jgi:hypothetical protein
MGQGEGKEDRRKHINIKYHYIREKVRDDKLIELKWIETSKQLADLFTKPLARGRFRELRDALMGYTRSTPLVIKSSSSDSSSPSSSSSSHTD